MACASASVGRRRHDQQLGGHLVELPVPRVRRVELGEQDPRLVDALVRPVEVAHPQSKPGLVLQHREGPHTSGLGRAGLLEELGRLRPPACLDERLGGVACRKLPSCLAKPTRRIAA